MFRTLSRSQRRRIEYMLEHEYSYRAMAEYVGVCTDTLKRMLVREGLAEFDGAKYAISPAARGEAPTWERPCMRCKDASPRPKWQYICSKCKDNVGDTGVPDDFLIVGGSDSFDEQE